MKTGLQDDGTFIQDGLSIEEDLIGLLEDDESTADDKRKGNDNGEA